MTLELVGPVEFADRLGLVRDAQGEVALNAIARLARRALLRWRITSRSEIRGYLYRQIGAAMLLSDTAKIRVGEVLEWILIVGEAQAVRVNGTERLLMTLPRVVICGDVAFVTGTVDGLPREPEQRDHLNERSGLVRWVDAPGGEPPDALLDAGFEVWGLREWIGDPGYVEHIERRGVASSSLDRLWGAVSEALEANSGPVTNSDLYRLVAGKPGDFFGRADQESKGTRWRAAVDAPDGLWCGARRGHGEGFTVPVVVQVQDGSVVRATGLYDWDEWRWALLSRGFQHGRERIAVKQGESIGQTCQLPAALRRLLEVTSLRDPAHPWRWLPRAGSYDAVLEVLVEFGGLSLQPLDHS